jgi:hypothetical protein
MHPASAPPSHGGPPACERHIAAPQPCWPACGQFGLPAERLPREIAYFIPPDPSKRIGLLPESKLVPKLRTC